METKDKHQADDSTPPQKRYDDMVGENANIVNNGIQPCTKNSLYRDTWSITRDYVIGQSWFCVEIGHHPGSGE